MCFDAGLIGNIRSNMVFMGCVNAVIVILLECRNLRFIHSTTSFLADILKTRGLGNSPP